MVSLSIHCFIAYTLASCGFRFCFFFILSIALPPLSITAYTNFVLSAVSSTLNLRPHQSPSTQEHESPVIFQYIFSRHTLNHFDTTLHCTYHACLNDQLRCMKKWVLTLTISPAAALCRELPHCPNIRAHILTYIQVLSTPTPAWLPLMWARSADCLLFLRFCLCHPAVLSVRSM